MPLLSAISEKFREKKEIIRLIKKEKNPLLKHMKDIGGDDIFYINTEIKLR